MISINRVTIENFQSHHKTVLDFEKGLNVIVGPSDQGKSAVLRAIKWALYNEPRGTEFIRQGTSMARVTVELNNGHRVIRERSQSRNRYVVISPDGTNTTFDGFGNEVPEEVVKAHGIPKVVLDTDLSSSLNIGDQLEGPFLLSETGAVRAKAIGRLTGLHIIDKALRDCLTDLRRENQTVDRLEGELKGIDEKLEEYSDLHLLEEKINASGQLIKALEESIQRKDRLELLLQSFKDITGESAQMKRTLARLEGLPQCEIYLRTCQLNAERRGRLERLEEGLTVVEMDMGAAEKMLAETAQLGKCSEALEHLYSVKEKFDSLHAARERMAAAGSELKTAEETMRKTAGIQNSGRMIEEIYEKERKRSSLQESSKKLALCGEEIARAEGFLAKSRDAVDCEKILQKVSVKTELLKKQVEIRQQYQSLLNNLGEGERFLESNRAELAESVREYALLLKQAGKCPLCDSEISDEKLEEIIKHYEEVH